jgi:hypothetical protein
MSAGTRIVSPMPGVAASMITLWTARTCSVRALTVGDHDQSANHFLEQFHKQIQAIGHVLEWLGLPIQVEKVAWDGSLLTL